MKKVLVVLACIFISQSSFSQEFIGMNYQQIKKECNNAISMNWVLFHKHKRNLSVMYDKGLFLLHFDRITKRVDKYRFFPKTGEVSAIASHYDTVCAVKTPSQQWERFENGNAVEISLVHSKEVKNYDYFEIETK